MHFVIVVIGVILIVAAAATAAVEVKGIGSRQAAEHLGVDVLAMQCTRQAPHPLLSLLLHHWTQAARGGGVRDLLIGTRRRKSSTQPTILPPNPDLVQLSFAGRSRLVG